MVSVLLSVIGCLKSWVITGGLGGLAGCGGIGCLNMIGKSAGDFFGDIFL